jgi:adenylate cyclase
VRGKVEAEFADIGEQSLKNIARPLRVFRLGPLSSSAQPIAPPAALPLPDKPSIAVLPFQNMSGDPEQEYFADGMVEEIITALSRIRWLFVIARNSSFTYKGQAVDVKQVGRELGVRYVLEGSVRKATGRVRITAQLIDTDTGAHLWADRFDGSLEDVFDLQDQVTTSVAGVIEPALQAAEIRRATALKTGDLTAYDLYLRGLAVFMPVTKERLFAANELFSRAINRDPDFAPALAWGAICQFRLHQDGWTADPDVTKRDGLDLAHRALQLAAGDPDVIANSVFPLAYFGEDIDAMMCVLDEALALNPSFARGWFVSGHVRVMAGHCELAIRHVENSMRLSPRARVGGQWAAIGQAHCLAGRFEDAVAKLLLMLQEHPGAPLSYRFLAASYAHLGRLPQACQVVARLLAIAPVAITDPSYLRNAEQRERLLSGLRLAMGDAE